MKTFTKITKVAINGQNLYITDHWVSNGHWVMNKAKAENAPVFVSLEAAKSALNLTEKFPRSTRPMDDEMILSLFRDAPYEYTVSAWVYQGQRQAYRLLTTVAGPHGLIDERYAKLFGLEDRDKLYSAAEDGVSAFQDKDKTFLVMPVSPGTVTPDGLPFLFPEDADED